MTDGETTRKDLMMFERFLEILDEKGGGVRAYEACANAARTRIKEEPEVAAPCFLIASAAQGFVEAYDDQPLSTTAAGEAYQAFKSDIQALSKAFSNGDAGERLETLNRVAANVTAQANH